MDSHTCENYLGFFIRMSLMKSYTMKLNDQRGPAGTITLGPGMTWSEAQYAVSQQNRFVSSGWWPDVVSNNDHNKRSLCLITSIYIIFLYSTIGCDWI